jgi:hypothetical protein
MVTLSLHACALECGRRRYDRAAYLRAVGDGWRLVDNRRPGRQADTLTQRLMLAERVWDATYGART